MVGDSEWTEVPGSRVGNATTYSRPADDAVGGIEVRSYVSEVTGPGRISCSLQCEIPSGITMIEVPPSRHVWSDVAACTNDGCDKQFLITGQSGDAS